MHHFPSFIRRMAKIARPYFTRCGVNVRHTQLLDAFSHAAGQENWHHARNVPEMVVTLRDADRFADNAATCLVELGLQHDHSALVAALASHVRILLPATLDDLFQYGRQNELYDGVKARMETAMPVHEENVFYLNALQLVAALSRVMIERRQGAVVSAAVMSSYLEPMRFAALAYSESLSADTRAAVMSLLASVLWTETELKPVLDAYLLDPRAIDRADHPRLRLFTEQFAYVSAYVRAGLDENAICRMEPWQAEAATK